MPDTGGRPGQAASGPQDLDYESAVTLRSPAGAVFDALTTPSGLAGWWCSVVSGTGLAGGELTFLFDGAPVVMRVEQAERPSVVRWTTLVSEPLPDWVGTTVSFEISRDDNGGTRVKFRHAGLTPRLDCFDFCAQQWAGYLASLAGYVDSGQGNPFGAARA
jgi:uncharacterized protein YndB with AHSA1/START domain